MFQWCNNSMKLSVGSSLYCSLIADPYIHINDSNSVRQSVGSSLYCSLIADPYIHINDGNSVRQSVGSSLYCSLIADPYIHINDGNLMRQSVRSALYCSLIANPYIHMNGKNWDFRIIMWCILYYIYYIILYYITSYHIISYIILYYIIYYLWSVDLSCQELSEMIANSDIKEEFLLLPLSQGADFLINAPEPISSAYKDFMHQFGHRGYKEVLCSVMIVRYWCLCIRVISLCQEGFCLFSNQGNSSSLLTKIFNRGLASGVRQDTEITEIRYLNVTRAKRYSTRTPEPDNWWTTLFIVCGSLVKVWVTHNKTMWCMASPHDTTTIRLAFNMRYNYLCVFPRWECDHPISKYRSHEAICHGLWLYEEPIITAAGLSYHCWGILPTSHASIAYRKQVPLNERRAPLAVNSTRAPLRRKLRDQPKLARKAPKTNRSPKCCIWVIYMPRTYLPSLPHSPGHSGDSG